MSEALLAVVMAPGEANRPFVFLLQFGAVIAIFYLVLIRPQRKEQDRQKQMIAAIAKGDEIVTNGGIIGTVIRADEDRLIIKTGGETKITVGRSHVASKVVEDQPEAAKK